MTNTNAADLAVSITASPDPVAASAQITYTIAVVDNGGLDATNVSVVQRLPAGNVSFVSATGIGWNCTNTGQTVTCTRTSLLVGAAPTIAVVVKAPDTGGDITSSVSVSSTIDDNDMSNNDASVTTSVLTPVDLSLAITETPDPVPAGGTATYSVTVTNPGPTNATGLTVVDTLDTGVTFVSASGPSWTCNASGQTVTCTLATIDASTTSTITIVATEPSSGGSTLNTATLTSTTPDNNTANNTAVKTDTVNAAADLAIAVTESPDPVVASGIITYSIDLNNAGPDAAANVVVTNQLPSGNVTFKDAGGNGWTCNAASQTVTCTRATLNLGAAPTITIHVQAPSEATTLTNSATVTTGSSDLVSTNNTASVSSSVTSSADLSVAVTDSPDPVASSSTLTYTIQVANAGPSVAQAASVTTTLPAGTTFQSASGTNWVCAMSGTTLTCTTPSLAVGNAPPIALQLLAPAGNTTITDTVTVATTTSDPVSGNNSATATTTVNAPADLALALSDSPDPVAANSTLTYTIDVTNNGPSDAQNLVVTDRLPDGNVAFQSAAGIGWTCSLSGQVVTCTRSTLIVGSAPSITIKITTPASFTTLVDTASVTSSTADSDNTNNSATVSTNGATPIADMSVAITDTPDPVQGTTTQGCFDIGQADSTCTQYTISVANAGPEDATGVSVVITLPTNGSFFNLSGTGWVCPAPAGSSTTCTRNASIVSGTSAPDITLIWKAPSPGGFSIVTKATVNTTSTDPNLANNTASQDTTVLP